MMRLLHYSDEPVLVVRSVAQLPNDKSWHGGRKPSGFWVSVQGPDDWYSWCKAESFRDCDAQVLHEVVLADGHGVLVISTLDDLLAFHGEFRADDVYSHTREVIDWPRVARKYRGIIIAPYRWEQRLNAPCDGWYYSWDCASGCIGDAAAIAEIRQLWPQAGAGSLGPGGVADKTACAEA